ncbi:MAG: YtxH domain-containing protein [Candidatus Gastranaerophilales bacterium]|nr:YtxH domain-containing protein [Candidatus Gastranaerophilales bacterium]
MNDIYKKIKKKSTKIPQSGLHGVKKYVKLNTLLVFYGGKIEMSKEDNSVSFGLGLLAGVIGGIVAGVLLAPKPGAETRKEVEDVVVDIAQKHAPEIQEAKRQALTSIDMMKYTLEKKYNKINDVIRARQLAKAKEKESTDYELN